VASIPFVHAWLTATRHQGKFHASDLDSVHGLPPQREI